MRVGISSRGLKRAAAVLIGPTLVKVLLSDSAVLCIAQTNGQTRTLNNESRKTRSERHWRARRDPSPVPTGIGSLARGRSPVVPVLWTILRRQPAQTSHLLTTRS